MLQEAGVEQRRDAAQERPGLRVLIVDDSDYVLRTARSLLEMIPRIGRVATARSGETALEMAARRRFDLCLVELSMEGLNGLETTRRLRALPDPPRVIMLSLYDDPEFRAAAEAAGADVLVQKPNLGACLEALLETLFGPEVPA